ncbi:MAG: hypothetical protein ACOYJ2_02795 [Rickettsiales bacterium]
MAKRRTPEEEFKEREKDLYKLAPLGAAVVGGAFALEAVDLLVQDTYSAHKEAHMNWQLDPRGQKEPKMGVVAKLGHVLEEGKGLKKWGAWGAVIGIPALIAGFFTNDAFSKHRKQKQEIDANKDAKSKAEIDALKSEIETLRQSLDAAQKSFTEGLKPHSGHGSHLEAAKSSKEAAASAELSV